VAALDKKDSLKFAAQAATLNTAIREYRNNIITKEPNSLLATLLKSMKEPEVPQNNPLIKKDSLFAYRYFKNHFWDGVNFYDDRLARTPFFEARLDKYFEQLVYPAADSVIKEIDWMLGFASASEEMQKFLLLKFVNRYLNQKYMWEDAVFVHLFEKYFAQKSYPWLTEQGKKVVTDRAYSLMANIMGSPAADIELPDSNGKKTTLYSLQAPYTLITIWDPACSHCKELVPRLDSLYKAKWKSMGLKMYALAKETDGTKQNWLSFISEHHLNDWVHVYYSKADDKKRVDAGIPGYSQLYDVQSFPTLYLLDKDKRIIAKKVTEAQVDEILNYKIKNN
jgi:thiol-disulfide isomerase/thioredoxin